MKRMGGFDGLRVGARGLESRAPSPRPKTIPQDHSQAADGQNPALPIIRNSVTLNPKP